MRIGPFDEPVVTVLRCVNCREPLTAVGARTADRTADGTREYDWVHDHGGRDCRTELVARPHNPWTATEIVEAELRRRAMDEALEFAGGAA
jgi:hypothetical protein